MVFQNFSGSKKSPAAQYQHVSYVLHKSGCEVHQWFVVKRCPSFDMLYLMPKNKDPPEFRVPKKSDVAIGSLAVCNQR